MAGSLSGQNEAKPELWLATQAARWVLRLPALSPKKLKDIVLAMKLSFIDQVLLVNNAHMMDLHGYLFRTIFILQGE